MEEKDSRGFTHVLVQLKKDSEVGADHLVGLDGCHLKGPYGGQLLTVVSTDANDGMYPTTWCVVEAVNNDNWH